MDMSKFLRNKIERQIKTNGINFIVYELKMNEYKEIEKSEDFECFRGIYHESNSYAYQSREVSNSGIVTRKSNPLLLCLKEVADKIQKEMFVEIDGKKYKVCDKRDFHNFHVAYDISLEEVEANNHENEC